MSPDAVSPFLVRLKVVVQQLCELLGETLHTSKFTVLQGVAAAFFFAFGGIEIVNAVGLDNLIEVVREAGLPAVIAEGYSGAGILKFLLIAIAVAVSGAAVFVLLFGMSAVAVWLIRIADVVAWVALWILHLFRRLLDCGYEASSAATRRATGVGFGHFDWSDRAIPWIRQWRGWPVVASVGMVAAVPALFFVLTSNPADIPIVGQKMAKILPPRSDSTVTLCFAGARCNAIAIRLFASNDEYLFGARVTPGAWSADDDCGQRDIASDARQESQPPPSPIGRFARTEIRAVLQGTGKKTMALCEALYGGSGSTVPGLDRIDRGLATLIEAVGDPKANPPLLRLVDGLRDDLAGTAALLDMLRDEARLTNARLGDAVDERTILAEVNGVRSDMQAIGDRLLGASRNGNAGPSGLAGIRDTLGEVHSSLESAAVAASEINRSLREIDVSLRKLPMPASVPDNIGKIASKIDSLDQRLSQVIDAKPDGLKAVRMKLTDKVALEQPIRISGGIADGRDTACRPEGLQSLSIVFQPASVLMAEPGQNSPGRIHEQERFQRLAERILEAQFSAVRGTTAPGYYLLVGDASASVDFHAGPGLAQRRATAACHALSESLRTQMKRIPAAANHTVKCLEPGDPAATPLRAALPAETAIRLVTSPNSEEFPYYDRDPSEADRRSVRIFICRPKPQLPRN